MEIQEKPHKPAYESRRVVRSSSDLEIGRVFIHMYDPRTDNLSFANGFWSNLPGKSKLVEKLILLELSDDRKKALFLSHSKFEQKEISLADLGVIPYENGGWNIHDYLVRAESSEELLQ